MDAKSDQELIAASLNGDMQALEKLIARYQPWIYNIAFRMVLVREDAEDATQEVLIKMLTKLSTYDSGKASFRTWLYRIVANHVINMSRRGYEKGISSFDHYYGAIAAVADESPHSIPDAELLIEDITIGCALGTMLCLDRKHRVAFILGVVFGVPDSVGADVLDISRAGFRQLLSRARKKIFDYMHGHCGLINKSQPCTCRNKAKGFMDRGYHTPDRITFVEREAPSVRDTLAGSSIQTRKETLRRLGKFNQTIYPEYIALFRGHPFYSSPDLTGWLRQTVQRSDFREIFRLDN